MALTTWVPRSGGIVTVLNGTDLASLASGSGVLSGTVSNTSNGDEYGGWLLTLALSASVAAGTTVELYFAQSNDGVTFEDAAGGATPVLPQSPAYVFTLNAGTGVHTQKRFCFVSLPSGDYKALLVQKSVVALSATGSSLTLQAYSEQTL